MMWPAMQAEIEARQKAKGENLTLDQLNATLHAQAAQVCAQGGSPHCLHCMGTVLDDPAMGAAPIAGSTSS